MMFGFEHDGVVPDLVAVSKTLGGGFPLAATITSGAIEEDCVRKGFLHVTSHVSDPLPAAAGLAVLDVIEEEGFVGQARQRGDYLLGRLRELQTEHEQIGDVRGRGLLVGLELVEERGGDRSRHRDSRRLAAGGARSQPGCRDLSLCHLSFDDQPLLGERGQDPSGSWLPLSMARYAVVRVRTATP
jgi:4-aminobutyrate aminotransferase-like enzyme